jgi:hypothetical protein
MFEIAFPVSHRVPTTARGPIAECCCDGFTLPQAPSGVKHYPEFAIGGVEPKEEGRAKKNERRRKKGART